MLENSLNKLTNFFRKGARIYRLTYKSGISYVFYLFSVSHYRSSHKNNGNIACLFVLTQYPGGFGTTHIWKTYIHNYDIRFFFPGNGNSAGSIFSYKYFKASDLQEVFFQHQT